jgi:hypothetical protein
MSKNQQHPYDHEFGRITSLVFPTKVMNKTRACQRARGIRTGLWNSKVVLLAIECVEQLVEARCNVPSPLSGHPTLYVSLLTTHFS